MTWQFLAGGGALGLAGVITALVFRIKQMAEQQRADREKNRADRATELHDDARVAFIQFKALVEEERRANDAVVAASRLNYAELQRRLEKYEALDPVLAGAHLSDVLRSGPGAKAGPAGGAAGVHADAAAPVAAGGRDGRGPR